MKIERTDQVISKPLLESLPLGTVFHLGITEHQTWLVCQGEIGAKYAACLESGELRSLENMPNNVSRLYHRAVLS